MRARVPAISWNASPSECAVMESLGRCLCARRIDAHLAEKDPITRYESIAGVRRSRPGNHEIYEADLRRSATADEVLAGPHRPPIRSGMKMCRHPRPPIRCRISIPIELRYVDAIVWPFGPTEHDETFY